VKGDGLVIGPRPISLCAWRSAIASRVNMCSLFRHCPVTCRRIGAETCRSATPASLKQLDKAVSRAHEPLDAAERDARARKATGRQEADAGDETAANQATDSVPAVVDEDGPSEDDAHDGGTPSTHPRSRGASAVGGLGAQVDRRPPGSQRMLRLQGCEAVPLAMFAPCRVRSARENRPRAQERAQTPEEQPMSAPPNSTW